MTATLEYPKDLAIGVLRKAGTGDNLLAALDALISYSDEDTQEVVTETSETVEWTNAVNLDDETEVVLNDEVIDF